MSIVLLFLYGLVCYANDLSNLDNGQIPVNARQPEMFTKRLRVRRSRFLNPPIHRHHRKTCYHRPTTNTQQGARRPGQFVPAHFLSQNGRRKPTTLWEPLPFTFAPIIRFWIKAQPFNQAFPTARFRNRPPVFPFRHRPHIPPDDLGKLPKGHLERNPPSPNRLNESSRRALGMESRHVVVTARQDPFVQSDAPLNNP
jgi:hypothetical protein